MGRPDRALARQLAALADAEPVLLVDDREPESIEEHTILNDGVGANQNVDLAVNERVKQLRPIPLLRAAGQELDTWRVVPRTLVKAAQA